LEEVGAEIEAVDGEPGSPGDAERTRDATRRLGADWLVLDGYHLSREFEQRARSSEGVRLLVVDDGYAEYSRADLILNQNLHASPELYPSTGPQTRLLLGPRFALLRREFWGWQGRTRSVPEVGRRILVTLGGSDPENVTLKVIRALDRVRVSGIEAVAVLGAANPHRDAVTAAVQRSAMPVELRVDVTDMAELIAWADVAVAAGGTATWERAVLGLPSLVLILAENQRRLAEASEEAGVGRNLGVGAVLDEAAIARTLLELVHDHEARASMARRGPELVDGQGARRVCRLLGDALFTLRPACAGDCRQVWEWANEPQTRAVSFTPDPIPWEQHQHWFAARVSDPGCAFFVALDGAGQKPIGQVRFERDGDEAVISVSLDGPCRGRGYGPVVIRRASWEVFRRWPVGHILAWVRAENEPSRRAFLKAGFRLEGTAAVRGVLAQRLMLRRDEVWLAS
jgi:UDP-2,4-diacetamido-2,4,6-trideoxy-beta-L-altropyranose hydrolase